VGFSIKKETDGNVPNPETMINAGGVLIASGYADGEEDLKRLASPE